MERNYKEILKKLQKELTRWNILKVVNFWLDNKDKIDQLLINFIEKMSDDEIQDDLKNPKDVYSVSPYAYSGSWKIWNNLTRMVLWPQSEEIKSILTKYSYYKNNDIKEFVKDERKKLLQIADDICKKENCDENEYCKAKLAKLLSQSYSDQLARFEFNWEKHKPYVRKVEYYFDRDIKYYHFEDVKEEQVIVDFWKELISK